MGRRIVLLQPTEAVNVLTFDIEEWFHSFQEGPPSTWGKHEVRIHRNVDLILEMLSEHRIEASFFCLGWIAHRHPELLKKIDSMGHEIGSHSYYHHLAHQLSYADFEEDLKASIYAIEDVLGKKVDMYRAPGYSIRRSNRWIFEILQKYGIAIDSSLTAIRSETGGFEGFTANAPCLIKGNDFTIKEFPLNYAKFAHIKANFTGGGYFRLFPYSLTKRLFAKSSYNMAYFHPRDFDVQQPIVDASLKRIFKNQIGLKCMQKKFEKLLSDFTFVDIRTATQLTSWDHVTSLELN